MERIYYILATTEVLDRWWIVEAWKLSILYKQLDLLYLWVGSNYPITERVGYLKMIMVPDKIEGPIRPDLLD